jgi:Fur family transcriptional regulator, peroxide stress response regulator
LQQNGSPFTDGEGILVVGDWNSLVCCKVFFFHNLKISFSLCVFLSKDLFKNCYYLIICMNNSQKSDAAAIEALRNKGYKATPQRIAICRIAIRSREHPSAQSIYDEVKKVHPTVSLATVYKTLQVLRELNLIQELSFPTGQARFDSYMKPHVNLVCLQCGSIIDLDDLTTGDFVKRVAAATKFKPNGQRIDIYGICQKCSSTDL